MTGKVSVTTLLKEIEQSPVLQPQRDRLAFLDGIRGAAALYVVLGHTQKISTRIGDGPRMSLHRVELVSRLLNAGGYGVVAFIILSGFCLMLPVARTADATLRGGWSAYLYRRCKRILPGYYCALLLTLLLIYLIPTLSTHPNGFSDVALPVTTHAVVTHFFLLHNITSRSSLSIDPPMWSVALEFQIYFLFPAILLPVYRRSGAVATAVFGYALAMLIRQLAGNNIDESQPQFIGLFCTGMVAAVATVGHGRESQWLARLPWPWIAFTSIVLSFALDVLDFRFAPKTGWVPHVFFAVGFVGVLISCAKNLKGTQTIRRVLESKWLVGLGVFSYSVYLIHMPAVGIIHLFLRPLVRSSDVMLAVDMFVTVPLAVLVSYGFYLLFERPFMRPIVEHQIARPDSGSLV